MATTDEFIKTKYGLNLSAFDAFSDKVAKIEHLQWWANRTEELTKWNALIEKATTTKRNYLCFIVGSYGRGKTLSLLKIVDEGKLRQGVSTIFMNLKSEERSAPGLDLLFRIFKNFDFFSVVRQKSPADLLTIIQSLPDNLSDVRNTLKAIYIGKADANQTKMFTDVGALKGQSISADALNFIKGYSISAAQLREMNVSKKIQDTDTAKEYLVGLLILLKKLNYTSLVIAVDEVESLFSQVSKVNQGTYLSLLRSLYDFPPVGNGEKAIDCANMVFFLGISEAGWSSLRELKNKEEAVGGPIVPLIQRTDEEIFLPVFTKGQTLELIEKRLKFNRSDQKFEEKPLIPFTEDFVDYVHSKTNGEPRQILVQCGHVLDIGIAEKVAQLDKRFAERVLKERGLI